MEDIYVQVLRLDDGIHEPCFLTKTAMYPTALEFIYELRDPHSRIYQIRSISYDDLEEWEAEIAWYAVRIPYVPHPMDASYIEFIKNFDILWERAEVLIEDVA